MNILHVIPSFAPAWRYGGPIIASLGLTTALAERGHNVKVFTTNKDGDGILPVETGKPVAMQGIEVTYFSVGFPKWYYFSFKLSHALKHNLPDFDIVHIHSVYLWPTTIASYWCRKLKIPYLVRPLGMLDSINVEKDYEYKITSFMSKIKKNTYMKFIGKHDLNNAAGIHYTSQYEKDLASKWEIKAEDTIIPLGVDIPKSNIGLRGHKITGIQGKLKTILFLSRLDPIKGIETLIKTINILYQIRKDFNLVIGGSGTKKYELKLRKIIDDNGLNDVISMIGNVDQLDKNVIFENADLFVLLSHHENFGIVVAEAMAMKIPVIISNNVGIQNYVKDYGAGLVISENHPELIARQIGDLLDDDKLRIEMGNKARYLCENEFAWDKVARQTEKYYELILSKSD